MDRKWSPCGILKIGLFLSGIPKHENAAITAKISSKTMKGRALVTARITRVRVRAGDNIC